MASESAINGTFVPQNSYGSIEQSGYTAPAYSSSNPSAPSQSNNSAADIPKDEVGWYFVEQYYTTLSRSPEKVYVCEGLTTSVREGHSLTSYSSSTTSAHNSFPATRPRRSRSVWDNGYVFFLLESAQDCRGTEPANRPSTSASRSLTSPSQKFASPMSIRKPRTTTLSSRSSARFPTSQPPTRSSPRLSSSPLRPTATLS
jgi:hypothetical protein